MLGKNPAEACGTIPSAPGLQMALFDVVGKPLEAPVWSLLGSKVRRADASRLVGHRHARGGLDQRMRRSRRERLHHLQNQSPALV